MRQVWLLQCGVDWEGEAVVCAFTEKPTAEQVQDALKTQWSGGYYESRIDLPAVCEAVLTDERAYAYADIYIQLETVELK